MNIEAECPLCGHKGSVPDKFDGKQVKCPECCNLFVVSPSKAAVGAGKSPTSGSSSGERKLPKNGATMPSMNLGKNGPSAGSASGEQKIKKAAETHQGTMKKPGAGSSSGQHKAVAPKPGSAQGTQKNPVKSNGSAQGNVKNPAKNATAGSAAGNQKVAAPKPGSGQGTQKKPAAKKAGGDPFASFSYDDAGGKQVRRRRKQGKAFGNLIALGALVVFLTVVGWGGYFTYKHLSSGGKVDNLFSSMLSSLGSMFKSEAKPTEVAAATEPEKKDTEPEVKPTEKKPEPTQMFNIEKEPAVVTDGKDITVQVKVTNVNYGPPPIKDAEMAKDKRLMIALEIENKGKSPINFQGWGCVEIINETHPPTMTDAAGTVFKRVAFPGGAEGQVLAAETIPPGKSLKDLVIFETPSAGTPFVKVELSGENIDPNFKERKFILLISQVSLSKANLPKPEVKPDADPMPKPKPEPKPDKEPAEVAILKPQLKSKLKPSREEAINGLAALGQKAASAAADVAELLKDPKEDDKIREAAAVCLGKFGPKGKEASIPALLEGLKKDDFEKVRAECATSLAMVGTGDEKVLGELGLALAKEKDDMVKKAIEAAIKRLDKKPADKAAMDKDKAAMDKDKEKAGDKDKAKAGEKDKAAEKDKAKE